MGKQAPEVEQLTTELAKIQTERKDTDQSFVDTYFNGSVSRQLWVMIRTGKRKPTAEILGMLLISFPALKNQINQALKALGKEKKQAV